MDERLPKVHLWLTFIGFHSAFLVQHQLDNEACPTASPTTCRPMDSPPLNTISTIGSFILGVSMPPFIWNVWKPYRFGRA